jgi:predicted SnoaL-like aldol condensation-catalyzing enzyme
MSSEDRASEENKDTVRLFYERVFGQGNLELADGIFADEYVLHDRDQDPAQDPETSSVCGPKGVKEFVRGLRDAFSELQVSIIENYPMAAEGDRVVTRFTVRGIFRRTPLQLLVEWEGMSISQFSKKGKITESWSYWESGRMYEQLGYFAMKVPGATTLMPVLPHVDPGDWGRPPRGRG